MTVFERVFLDFEAASDASNRKLPLSSCHLSITMMYVSVMCKETEPKFLSSSFVVSYPTMLPLRIPVAFLFA